MPDNRRQLAKTRTRERLLAAARLVLKRRGLSGTTTREITREAGVAAGTFFTHFSEVDALVEALLDEHLERALEQAERSLPKKGGIIAQLVHVADKLFASYAVEPELSRAFLTATLFSSNTARPTQRRLEDFRRWVERRIQAAVACGELPRIDPDLAFTGFFSLYFCILVAGLRGHMTRPQQTRLLEASLRQFLSVQPGGRQPRATVRMPEVSLCPLLNRGATR